MSPAVSISVALEQIKQEPFRYAHRDFRSGFGKGSVGMTCFYFSVSGDLSWEDLKAQSEARGGDRSHQKGLFTGTSGGWAGWT